MKDDFIFDFLCDLCKDLTYAVDIDELAQATRLNPNTISCFGYRSKEQLPSGKQLFQMLGRVYELHPEAAQMAIKRINRLFDMAGVPLNGDALKSLKALIREMETRNEPATE